MRRQYQLVATLIIGLSMTIPGWASEKLLGAYEGKIKEVEGYGGKVGETCVVKIEASDRFGGSTTFRIDDSQTLLFGTKEVDAALGSTDAQAKLYTPGGTARCDETVVMNRRPDGTLRFLKLVLSKCGSFQRTKFIACGELTKKQ
jgi:hypothetical protein